jgi:hypothetical protein
MLLPLAVKEFTDKFQDRKPLLSNKECSLFVRVIHAKNCHVFKHLIDKAMEF